ncbi:pyridoxal-phosphate dependent enzyme [Natronolimnobius sp. AArcel1]|uniref:pyridoxal-phosphate dependent enzyme n=1 Tax=Natronolimnobius sp. AArcel1 TaxID=1679093 RepID=UPI0013E9B126|nr:pyridoxal-phosphate dependent enzyme [Natronolimnobius sp. AArcel1]
MNNQIHCYSCGNHYELAERTHCTCGETLWLDIDSSGFEWPSGGIDNIWRYADVLPTIDHIGVNPGGTPLVRSKQVDEFAGCCLSLKVEGCNPTGSFKDRGSAIGVGYAASAGYDWVGTVSHGNMALSTSAYAAAADLNCAVFVPAETPPERLELISRHDPNIYRVEGDYSRLYTDTLSLETNICFVNSDTPLRVAGQKTTAYEILESFAPSVPDAIVLPTSSGGHVSGVWKALCELEDADVIDEVPQIYVAQAASCDPIVSAYRKTQETVTAIDPDETIAVSIANSNPPSGTRALTAVRDTNGGAVAVTDDETRTAMDKLATVTGISVEPSSAVAVAGIRKLSREGIFASDDEVAAILTGTGYTERFDSGRDVESDLIDVSTLESKLEQITK